MAYLKNLDGNRIITRYVSCSQVQDLTLTVQTALDGTEYLTRFGTPIRHYELALYVDEAGKTMLLAAADVLPLLEVSVKQGLFYGRILEVGRFDLLAAGWHKTTVVLAAVSEVTAQ